MLIRPFLWFIFYVANTLKNKVPLHSLFGDFNLSIMIWKTPGLIKMYFIDNQRRIFMKQQVIEDVNIMPQLQKACGIDMLQVRNICSRDLCLF